MDNHLYDRHTLSSQEYPVAQEVEAALYSRALGFIFPLVTFMIIGTEIGDGIGALIGLLTGGITGIMFNTFLSRLVKRISAVLMLAATIGVILLMILKL
jgi:hypothetical protein